MGRGISKINSSNSNEIKNRIMKNGLNSRFKGVVRDAQSGTGNYSFKNASPVSAKQALNMSGIRFKEDGKGNTLAWGLIGQKEVYYGGKTDSDTIKTLKEKAKGTVTAQGKININPTTTYDRWKKRHDANFAAWFGRRI